MWKHSSYSTCSCILQVRLILHKFWRPLQIRSWFVIMVCMCIPKTPNWQQSGAAEACWAHNPEVDGSKPSSANCRCFQLRRLHRVFILFTYALIATTSLTEMSCPFSAVVDTIIMLQAADAVCAVADLGCKLFIAKYVIDLSQKLWNCSPDR